MAPGPLAVLVVGWAVLVLAVYYRQAWAMLVGGVGTSEPAGLELYRLRDGLPYAGDAFRRAAWGVLGGAMAWLSAALLGRAALRFLAPRGMAPVEVVVFAAALGIWLLSYSFFGLALLGLYRPGVATICLAIGSLASLAAFYRARPLAALRCAPARLAGPDALWKAAVAVALAIAAFTALAPEIEYDALWYHLGLPQQWLAAGRPVDNVHDFVSLYPLTWDLVFGAAAVIGGPPAASLVHWATLPLSALASGLLARRIGAPAWLAAAIVVTAPTVLWQATTTYVDLALALHVALAAYALTRAHDTRDDRWVLMAGLQLGIACATKHLGLVAVLVLAGLTCLVVLRRDGLGRAIRVVAILGLLALLLPLPWYARAWAASGNPVSPEMYGLFGARPPQRWDDISQRGHDAFKARFGQPRTVAHQLRLPWDLTMHASRYGGTFGPLALMLAPGLIFVALRQPHARAILAGTAVYVAVWASPVSSFQARFLVPAWVVLAPVMALALAAVSARVRLARPRTAGGMSAGVFVLLLANLPPFTKYHEGDRAGWDGWLTHVVHVPPIAVVLGAIGEDAYLRDKVRSYTAWQWLDAHVPLEGTRVLTFSGGDQYYTRHARLWSESVVARPAVWGAHDAPSALAYLERLNVTHVLAPAAASRTAEHQRLPLLQAADEGLRLHRVHQDYWYEVYRLRTEDVSEAVTTDQR